MRGSVVFSLLLLFSADLAWSGRIDSVRSLPTQSSVAAVQRDAAGNLYLGGSVPASHPRSDGDIDAFVAKLSSDASKVLFWTVLSGSQIDSVKALALAPDGSILAVGTTGSTDFPVTQDAAEHSNGGGVFFARLGTNGNVVYASYLTASGQVFPEAMASDASGAAYITGLGILASTPGTLPAISSNYGNFFLLKLDATGKPVFATGGIGGSVIAVDAKGFIYVAGGAEPGYPLPVTPGAFQTTTPVFEVCEFGRVAEFPCSEQYVAKLDPAASKLVYATWLTGSSGSSPNSLSVDSEGNTILVGSTRSSDYPVTPGAFQTTSFAALPPVDNTQFDSGFSAHPSTGYVTKLNATGTGLVFSTFIGGSGQDVVNSMAADGEGNLYLAGVAASPDFPGLNGLLDRCRPNYVYPVPFFTRLSADGSALTATQLAFGAAILPAIGNSIPDVTYPHINVFDGQGKAVFAVGGSLWSLDLFAPTPQFSCMVDVADLAPLAQIAPGQLVTLYGKDIGSHQAAAGQPQNGRIPTSLGDGGIVTFNNVAAPILFSSPDQINVQVPYEIVGQATAHMEVLGPGGGAVGSRGFAVVGSAPSVFVTEPEYATCRNTITNSLLPVVHNADGSHNSCDDPAGAASIVTLLVNGLGLVTPDLPTGAISNGPPAKLKIPVAASGDATLLSVESVTGFVNSVWRAKVLVNPVLSNGVDTSTWLARFTLTIGGVPLRDPLVVWGKAPLPNQ